jgi:hypothetical protein
LSDDALADVRRRIDELLNIDIPLMVSRGLLSDEQLYETVGVLSLWMRAVMGDVDSQTAHIISSFLEALQLTYPDERTLAEKVHGHISAALNENPALLRMRGHLEDAVAAVPNDPQVGASQAFLHYSTRPAPDADVLAYFEILLGVAPTP